MTFRVLHEDNHLLVVDKPAGVLSQSDRQGATDDLLSQAKQYIKIKYNKPGEAWLGLVHRLDREVGGVMIFARTSKAAARLSEEIREGRTRKIYRALVERAPVLTSDDPGPDAEGWTDLEDYLSKDPVRRIARAAKPGKSRDDAKWARLRYRIVTAPAPPEQGPVLVEVELETGRFHQIRFQLSKRKAPILGDVKYGARQNRPGVVLALHCVEMGVRHPVGGEFLNFVSPVPRAWSA